MTETLPAPAATMFPDTTYISLGISPKADAIVLQAVAPGSERPSRPCPISIAELDSRGRPEANNKIGGLTLGAMSAYYPMIKVFLNARVVPTKFKPLCCIMDDHSGRIRERHLRIHAASAERSLVIRRFDSGDAAGHDTPPMQLDTLFMVLEPTDVLDFVGTTVLADLIALHPDVFAPFPDLRAV